MKKEEVFYLSIGNSIKNAEESQMFGKPCFKINGKAFVCFFQNEMVFKLTGEKHADALNLKGTLLFDPSGKKRPMKEWVQVPYKYKEIWEEFAVEALEYVKGLK
jgi:hypothetical protein